MIKYLFFITILLFISFGNSYGDIYVYVDDNGILSFSNTPTSPNFKFYMKEMDGNSSSGGMFITEKPLDNILKYVSAITSVDSELIRAIIKAESSFIKTAVSRKGAKGLMQLMPWIIKKYKVNDPFDPGQNIMAGTKYFKKLLKMYDGNIDFALAAYNAGPGSVSKYKGIPPYPETINYVKKVNKYYRQFKN